MPRMGARRWGEAIAGSALVVSVVGAAACSFVTSLDGLTGGAADAGEPSEDAPFVAVDSGGVVTTRDAGEGTDASSTPDADASAPADSSSDASPSDAGADVTIPSAYCASLSPAPLFCDDFDEDTADAALLTIPWDQVTQSNGSVVRSGGIVTSPPLAMLVTSTAGASSIDLCGYKTFTTVPASGKQLVLAFDIDVVAPDTTTNSDAVLAAIELIDTSGHRWAMQLEVTYDAASSDLAVNYSQNGNVSADASTTYLPHPVATRLPIGSWTRVKMDVTVGSSPGAALLFGSTSVAKLDITPQTTNGHPEILVGETFAEQSTQGWVVRYDDVTFDIE